MRPLRIGVNALYLIPGGVGGTEIYLRNLLAALSRIDKQNEYWVFTNRETGPDLLPADPRFHQECQKLSAVHRPWRLLWEQICLPFAVRRLQLDCLLNPGFTAPYFAACPNVTVFHDLQHKRHPENFRVFDLPFWNLFLYLSVNGSSLLLADSEETRADLCRYYHLPEEKVVTAPLGVEEEFFKIADERNEIEPLLLCVSTLHPHKNLDRLVRVFARLREKHTGFRLVIAGLRGFHTKQVEAAIAEAGLQEWVHLTGWIPRSELYALFRRAHTFIYPSTFEGFGLPVVEAMAAGVPLACSAIEPLRSIAGDAAVQFDPGSDSAMLRALEAVIGDDQLRSRLVEAGRARARHFRWEESARITLGGLEQAVKTPKRGIRLSPQA